MWANRYSFKVFFILLVLAAIPACSGDNTQTPTQTVDASETYYDYLATSKLVDHPSSQSQTLNDSVIFSENTSIFALTESKQTNRLLLENNPLQDDFAIYSPPAALAKKVSSTVMDSSFPMQSSLPSIKKADVIPAECAGLSADNLRECLDNGGFTSAPENEHVSLHDTRSISIQIGADMPVKIIEKTLNTLKNNVSQESLQSLLTNLNNLSINEPALAKLDLSAQKPFESSGYQLSNVTVSDSTMADSDSDGVLEPHTTVITELIKPTSFIRQPSEAVDSCISRYKASPINDRYVLKLSTLTHLKSMKNYRQSATFQNMATLSADSQDVESAYNSYQQSLGINQAFDANILKSIYAIPEAMPQSSTEYSLMFQLAPELMREEYHDLLSSMANANDVACQEIIEQHINPRTALVSASTQETNKTVARPASIFYQVPVVFKQQFAQKLTSAILGGEISTSESNQPFRDYCMVDGNGKKVALLDPATGLLTPACEKTEQKHLAKTVQLTKQGACKGDKSEAWAYYPSQMRTPRFGRGGQYILTEWLIHNQVADYKNIHAYQSLWKSGVQVAVRGGKIVAATWFLGQLKAARFATAAAPDILFATNALMQYIAPALKAVHFKIAGYKFKIPDPLVHFVTNGTGDVSKMTGSKKAGYLAFIAKLLTKSDKSMVVGFLAERFTDSVAELLDLEIVGWQDLSDGSHNGCFKFD